MKYLKLFEEMSVEEKEFPVDGYNLSPRETNILKDLVGDYLFRIRPSTFWSGSLTIKVEDHCYYTKHDTWYNTYYNVFDEFNELKDYILLKHYVCYKMTEEYLELLKNTKLDPSFDDNTSIKWASSEGHLEIVKYLLNDTRVDPSVDNNTPIRQASRKGRYREIVRLLLKDERVRSKLTDYEIRILEKQ